MGAGSTRSRRRGAGRRGCGPPGRRHEPRGGIPPGNGNSSNINGNNNSGLAFDAFFAVAAGDVGTAAAFLEAGGDPNLRTLAPLR